MSPNLQETCNLLLPLVGWIRGADYTLFAVALAMLSLNASLLGRFSMSRFAWLCCGVFLLSATPALLSFLTNGGASVSCDAPRS